MKRLALLGVLAVAAGCGGGSAPPRVVQPHLPRALAQEWRAQADAVATAMAARDGCTAQAHAVALNNAVIAAINAHKIAPRFQEPLQSAVNDLASRIGCTPPPAPVQVPLPHGKAHKDHGRGHDNQGDGGD